MWKENRITSLCNIRFPIVQAPMANISSPRLVASVSNAGGLGSLGAAYLTPDSLRSAIREIRTLTEAPFAVNLFAAQTAAKEDKKIAAAKHKLDPLLEELGIPHSSTENFSFPNFFEQAQVLLEEKVPIFSFCMGIPSLTILQLFKKQNTLLMGTATTVDEALLLESSGVDAIVAQGIEAGGHRSTFLDPLADPCLSLGTLLPQLSRKVKVPLIAAGGIMNGEGIAAALALGASGVQMGTAFIACPESDASATYKKALLHAHPTNTTMTTAITGKPARVIENRWTKDVDLLKAVAPFPYQHLLTREIRTIAAKMERPDLIALYAGQNYAMASNRPAAQLISIFVEQTWEAAEQLFQQLSERSTTE